jgi:tetratricopeptide (TPR) repeat protein
MQVEKTVFISYRRTNVFNALAIYQNLTAHGFDVFFDYESIKSGSFEQIILNQIAARAHFVVLLTPSALERCNEPGDWLRREIEHALDSKRNIVPLMFEGFSFRDVQQYLTGRLAILSSYNAITVPAEYFDAAMHRLRNDFLNVSLDVVLHPTTASDRVTVQQVQAAAAERSLVTENQLTAEELFEKAYQLGETQKYEAAIIAYDEGIRLNPHYSHAFHNRGWNKSKLGKYNEAITDYNKAIRLNPQDAEFYYNRGIARYAKGDIDRAIADFNKAIQLHPCHTKAYNNRGNARAQQSDYDAALTDYNEAIRLDPLDATAYNNRGVAYYKKLKFDTAIADYDEAIRLDPLYAIAYENRGLARQLKVDTSGAFDDFNEAIRLNPQNASAYKFRAMTRFSKGDTSGANSDYQSYLELGGEETESIRNLLTDNVKKTRRNKKKS